MVNPLVARLADRPLAIAPHALRAIDWTAQASHVRRALDGLPATGPRLDARPAMLPARNATSGASHVVTEDGIAVVPIVGPLVTRGDWLTDFLGAGDYGAIASAVEAALANPSARGVLLEIDSPGGEVGGLFDLVARLSALRAAAAKPVWAVASECALSAAYAIASVAERIYVTRTAEIGSIGVVAVHVDASRADAMAGLAWTLIHAGARKIDGHPHAPLSAGAAADIQADVDALHADLVALVARNRNMRPDAVRVTEAAIYRGRRGIDAGLADAVGGVDQALADLAATLDQEAQGRFPGRSARTAALPPSRRPPDMPSPTRPHAPAADAAALEITAPGAADRDEAAPDITPAPAPSAPAGDAAADKTAPATPPDREAAAAQLRSAFAEIAAIAAQAGRLGLSIDAADAMAKEVSPEALRRSVLDALSQRAEANVIFPLAPSSSPSNGSESPIVRRARERASAARS